MRSRRWLRKQRNVIGIFLVCMFCIGIVHSVYALESKTSLSLDHDVQSVVMDTETSDTEIKDAQMDEFSIDDAEVSENEDADEIITDTAMPDKEVYNDKISSYLQELLRKDNSSNEEEIRYTINIFFEKIAEETVDVLVKDVQDYEQRLALIQELYLQDMEEFAEKYSLGSYSPYHWKLEQRTIRVNATKREILQFAEEKTVIQIGAGVVDPMEEGFSEIVLLEAKSAARAALRGYKDVSLYRPEQQAEIENALEEGIAAIRNASSVFYVRRAVKTAEEKMDAVKTHQQLLEEENNEAGDADDGINSDSGNVDSGNSDAGNTGNDGTEDDDIDTGTESDGIKGGAAGTESDGIKDESTGTKSDGIKDESAGTESDGIKDESTGTKSDGTDTGHVDTEHIGNDGNKRDDINTGNQRGTFIVKILLVSVIVIGIYYKKIYKK